MTAITLRGTKGSPLTNQEVDNNFSGLNNDKYQSGDSPTFASISGTSLNLSQGITALGYNNTNWDSAFSWGNHASAGYLTAAVTSVTHDSVNTKLVVTFADSTTLDIPLDDYIDDTNLARLVGGSIDAQGTATFTRDDSSTFTIDFSSFLDDTNNYVDSVNFASGVLTLGRSGLADLTVNLDGRYLQSLPSHNHDDRYYLKAHIDSTFVTKTSSQVIHPTNALTVSNDTITLHKGDGTSESVSVSDAIGTDYFVVGAAFNSSTGVLTLTRNDSNTVSVDLDGRYLQTETDNQTLSWNASTGQVSISNGNSIDLDGRYAYTSHVHPYLPLAGGTVTGTIITAGLTIGSSNKIQFANNDYIRYDDANGVGRFHFDSDGGTNNASVQAATFVGALSGNADSSSRWATPRTNTVTLTGDVTGTGSASVDGSGNWTVTVPAVVGDNSHSHSNYVQKSGDTMTGALILSGAADLNFLAGSNEDAGDIVWKYYSGNEKHRLWDGGTGLNYRYNGGTAYKLFHEGYHPNADKWTTARTNTVTLTGDVTGTASSSVDGSGNWTNTLVTAVGNDSHTHSNYLINGSDSEQTAHFGIVNWNQGASRVNSDPRINEGGYDADLTSIHWWSTTATGANYGRVGHALYNGSAYQYLHTKSGQNSLYHNNSIIWTSGNDGSGTGLDADLLDGQHGSYYAPASHGHSLTLSGDVTGSGSVSGTISVSVNDDSHNHVWGNIDGASVSGLSGPRFSTSSGYIEFGPANTSHAHIYTDRPNFYFNKQLVVLGNTVWNSGNDGSGSGLDADLLDGQHGSYYYSAGNPPPLTADPTLTLTGDVTGSATFTNLGNATLTATVANDSHTHDTRYPQIQATFRSGAQNFDNFKTSGFHSLYNANATGHVNAPFTYGAMLSVGNTSDSGGMAMQLAHERTGAGTYIRGMNDTNDTWYGWQRVFMDNYHPNADKWTTARSLSLTGDVTGSVSWDGSANVSITTVVANDSHSHSNYVQKSGDTMTGNLLITGSDKSLDFDGHSGIKAENKKVLWSHNNGHVTLSGAGSDLYLGFNSGTDYVTNNIKLNTRISTSTGTTTIIDTDGTLYYQGQNTDSRYALAHSHPYLLNTHDMTLTLSGDASGSTTFNNMGNATLSVTVANDSHSHTSLGSVNFNNGNLSNVNHITFNDPGPNEGLEWLGGSGWKVYESPDDLTTNSAGNLQFVQGSTRRMTLTTGNNLDIAGGNLVVDDSKGISNSGAWTRMSNPYGYIDFGPSNTTWAHIYTDRPNFYFNKNLYVSGSKVWHQGNDGSGSGLDADLLDGNQASAFALAHSHPYLPLSGGTVTGNLVASGGLSVGTGTRTGNLNNVKSIAIGDSDTGFRQNGDGVLEVFANNQEVAQFTSGDINLNKDTDVTGYLKATGRTNFGAEKEYFDINVGGDANTYYPVGINSGGAFGFQRYSISRGYSWTAPSTWNTASHKGGLTFTYENCGDGAWGGNDKDIRVVQFAETYTTMVGGLALATSGGPVIVWLRGGGAQYRIHHPRGMDGSASIYLSGFTASNGTVFSSRAYSSSTVSSEVYNRYPVRGTGSLYSYNSQVWHSGNDGSGTGLDADLLDGQHGSYYAPASHSHSLTLSGDVTGSGSVSGTISVSVNDDSHSHSQVYIPDTRGASRAPSYYPDRNVSWDFQQNTNTGAGGDSWHVINTIAKWSSYDPSHRQEQVVYTGTNVKHRTATSDSAWGGWATFWDSANDGSGSGLDADLLDGQHGSYYYSAGNPPPLTADPTLTLTGDVTGSATFTNLGNATLTATVANDSHTHDGRYYTETESDARFVNVTGDTMTGAFTINRSNATGDTFRLNNLRDSTWAFNFTTNDVGNDNHSGFWIGDNGYPDMRLRREDSTVRALISSWEESYLSNGLRLNDRGLTIEGSESRGSYTSLSNYKTGADNIVLKGNSSGVSGIFFESEKNGTNINHNSDFGFIQFSPYGTGTSGESNELIIGVSNDADDHVILNAPNNTGTKIRVGASTTDYSIFHDNYHPNADKWTTARSLSLTGDVTGSVSWDGSANASITTVVANDSHSHSNYLPTSGKAADSNLLDGRDSTNYGATLATYGTTAGTSGRIRITAPFNTNSEHMFQVTVSVYSSYTCHEYVVSGYMYPTTNQWYSPKVVYSGTGSPDIVVGRDSSGKAYISIANASYTGVRVHNMTMGYGTSLADTYDPWTITITGGTENSVTPTIYKTWNSGNDGSGSGLDADLLDGQQGSYYAPVSSIPSVGNGVLTIATTGSASGGGTFSANQSGNTTITINATDTNTWRGISDSVTSTSSSVSASSAAVKAAYDRAWPNTTYNFAGSSFTSRNTGNVIAVDSATTNTVGYCNGSTAAGYADGGLFVAAYSTSWVSQIFSNFRNGELSSRGKNNGTWQSWRTQWSSGNDGSGSGLDADLLDGNQASAFVKTSGTSEILGGLDIREISATPPTSTYIRFANPAGSTQRGAIYRQYGSLIYGTSSDYRLKENIVPLSNAAARVNAIPVKRFNFIDYPERHVDGFLAHELAAVIPEAVVGEHDEVDQYGTPVYQSIDQSKLVPLLTAGLQEALAEIENLKARLSALEN